MDIHTNFETTKMCYHWKKSDLQTNRRMKREKKEEYSKCLKFELLKSKLLKSKLLNSNLYEIWTFVSLDFRHCYVSENRTLGSDFRHFTKMSEIQTHNFAFQTHFEKSTDLRQCLNSKLFRNRAVIECLKSVLVQISDTHCIGKWYTHKEEV